MSKVLKAAWFGTKVGLGVGVVYATVDQGIWGSSRQAAAAYDRLYDIMPGTKNVSEKYLQLPKKEDVNINFRSYWNTGIFYTFDFIANIPTKIIGLKDSTVDFISSSFASEKPKEVESKPEESQAAASPPPPAASDAGQAEAASTEDAKS
ncbi:uncharacterized protein QIL1 isoform X2 [Penaeus vannamei]|uniref:uncharacterized protein QIL1 isoform X2 n=1 Tax=Penaeus vannamei TaxID=6689 RepID=UPI000F6716A7|nr:uncharacterized protein LOC113827213 [Penaeus vannamei]